MYKVLQTFEVPGFPLFEAGKEYGIIPNVGEMITRGLVAQTEKMVETPPTYAKAEEKDKDEKADEVKNSKRVAK